MYPRTHFQQAIILRQIMHAKPVRQNSKSFETPNAVFDHDSFAGLLLIAEALITGPFLPPRLLVGEEELGTRIDLLKALKTRIYAYSQPLKPLPVRRKNLLQEFEVMERTRVRPT
jgi:hypothetical protein